MSDLRTLEAAERAAQLRREAASQAYDRAHDEWVAAAKALRDWAARAATEGRLRRVEGRR